MPNGYRFRKDDQDTWSKVVLDVNDELFEAMKARVPQRRGPYVLQARGGEPTGKIPKRNVALDRALRWLRAAEVGTWVEVTWPSHELRIGVLDLAPADVSGAELPIRRIVGVLQKTYPQHHNLGVCNCRRIDGSQTWSQHAFCRAYDAGGPLDLVVEMGDALVELARDGELAVGKVIYNRRVWTPEKGYYAYTGTDPHTGHLHVEPPNPKDGTPPCAR